MQGYLGEFDPEENTTTWQYDNLYRLVTQLGADPDGEGTGDGRPATHWTYDVAGQVLTETDALGRVTGWSYDQLGRVTGITQPHPVTGTAHGPVTSFSYDTLDRMLTRTDPDPDGLGLLTAPVTAYAWDGLGRNIRITEPDPDGADTEYESPVTTFHYDAGSQLIEMVDPMERLTEYGYNVLGYRTLVTLPDTDGPGGEDPPEYTYTFDTMGNELTEVDPLNNLTQSFYDDLYRLIRVEEADLDAGSPAIIPITRFDWDEVGNLTGLTDPLLNQTVWIYDDLDRVVEETNELLEARTFAYDAVGNLQVHIDRNGRRIEYDYDNLYRQIEERWQNGSTVVREIGYEYDLGGQLLSASDPDSSYTFEYDSLGRTTEVDNAGTPGVPNVVLTSTWDELSRRTLMTSKIDGLPDFRNTFFYDTLSRMTRAWQRSPAGTDRVAHFAYNDDGQFANIRREVFTTGWEQVATSIYEYDDAGRLEGLEYKHGTTVIAGYAWTHDLLGRVETFTSTADGS